MDFRKRSYPARIYRAFNEEDPHQLYRNGNWRMQFKASDFVGYGDDIESHPSTFGWSVHRFARVLQKHLRKHERPFHSPLLSASGDPYWTLYRIGQRRKGLEGADSKFVGLAVFDVREIFHSRTWLWYVPDLIHYFDPERNFFSVEDRLWAQNNNEYVVWGFFPARSALHWSSWEELSSPAIGLILPSYTFWYTLGLFRRYASTTAVDCDIFADRLLKLACQILGEVRFGSEVVGLAHELSKRGDFGYSTKYSNGVTLASAIDRQPAVEVQRIREQEGTKQGDHLNNALIGLTLKD